MKNEINCTASFIDFKRLLAYIKWKPQSAPLKKYVNERNNLNKNCSRLDKAKSTR